MTYEGFAAARPQMAEQTGEYGAMMNGYPKYGVSGNLEESLGWNNSTLIKGNIVKEVARLKQQPGKDVLIFGSADLVNTLLQHDLIDEYRLLILPVIVGGGKQLFSDGNDSKALRLIETKTFGSGVIALSYRQAKEG
ncbi:MAG: dihydrofolate reductase family protein [Actinomycetota bacterium]|nr:dihydrofolate reductase family protein [Actinomycetota bacterium]